MKHRFLTLLILGLLALPSSALWAQEGNYVMAAHLETSITHQLWPDVFINGHKIVDSAAHLFDAKSHIVMDLSPAQLCYILPQNCLSLEVDQTLATAAGTGAVMGLAYNLKITLSDGSVVWVSGDQGGVRSTLVKKGGPEPPGWASVDFDDSSWDAANAFTPTSMGTTLIDPQTGGVAKYFSLWKDGATTNGSLESLGEHYYFRQKFNMDVITRPGCVAPRDNKPKPTATPRPTNTPWPTFTPLPPPPPTFTPRPTNTPRPTATPRPRPTPIPTHTPRPIVRLKPRDTDTPFPTWTDTPVPPRPTATPRPRRHRPTATPTDIPLIPTDTPMPIVRHKQPVYVPPTKTFTPVPVRRKRPTATPTAEEMIVPTDTPISPQDMGMAATIVFVNPPVNIDASFADGPGRYKLEIVDNQGAHVITLFNKHIAFEKETWLSWDGTNDQGQLMHYGSYFALFSKDGQLIQKIALTWIPPGKNEGSADEP